ncbi:hypothetical protein BKA70DRAFT_1316181, partial [Coprinopsis sp. MPI-PUGE-AT-0042]
ILGPQMRPAPRPSMLRRTFPVITDCKPNEQACPIYRGYDIVGWNCIDIQRSLTSCGGCSVGENGALGVDGGRDCSSIPHADEVGCIGSKCVIESCRRGYAVMALEQDSCVRWKQL